jgi:hypothetical protein
MCQILVIFEIFIGGREKGPYLPLGSRNIYLLFSLNNSHHKQISWRKKSKIGEILDGIGLFLEKETTSAY